MDKISTLHKDVVNLLDANKALDIVSIDLDGKSSIADQMIIASGTSSRHIQALSEQVYEYLKKNGVSNCKIEGRESSDWKLVDGIDLIIHIFNPEKRKFYELEKIWSELIPKEKVIIWWKNLKHIVYFYLFFFFVTSIVSASEENDIYKKIAVFSEVLDKINKEFVDEVNQSDAMDAAINGVLQSLDPYSAYMSPDSYQSMQTETSGEFGGLGIEVSMEAGVIKVITPMDDSPAAEAGVKAGDYIVRINDIQVQGKSLSEAVDIMRGPVGSDIEITVRRRGERKALVFNITREKIKVSSVKSEILGNQTGYLRLTSFNENSSGQIRDKIKEFKKNENVKNYILDLRNNPGGLLSQAIKITDFFIDSGEIVSTKSKRKYESRKFFARKGDILDGDTIVVLINYGSASASEIVAGALKDHKRAIIIGENSYGKGSVQSIIPLKNKGAIRLTVSKYYLPSGKSISEIGVSPDIEVAEGSDDFRFNTDTDNQLQFALELLNG